MGTKVVQDFMSTDTVTIEANENLITAFDIMLENNIRHLPVVDEDGNLEGILSDRDLIREAILTKKDFSPDELRQALSVGRVRDVMSRKLDTVEPDDDIAEAGSILLENKISSLPVLNGVKLVGILTESDFVRAWVMQK